MQHPETYLGDGLYASFDGYRVWLRAPREGGNHYVALEPEILDAFERFCISVRLGHKSEDDV